MSVAVLGRNSQERFQRQHQQLLARALCSPELQEGSVTADPATDGQYARHGCNESVRYQLAAHMWQPTVSREQSDHLESMILAQEM